MYQLKNDKVKMPKKFKSKFHWKTTDGKIIAQQGYSDNDNNNDQVSLVNVKL
jgi:hypothetical protein